MCAAVCYSWQAYTWRTAKGLIGPHEFKAALYSLTVPVYDSMAAPVAASGAAAAWGAAAGSVAGPGAGAGATGLTWDWYIKLVMLTSPLAATTAYSALSDW